MKVTVSKLMVTLLSAGCLALAACGGGSADTTSSGGETAKTTEVVETPAADPSEKFIGDWKLAGVISQGITMTGDLSAMFESEETSALSIKSDGTGTLTFADDSNDITWKQKDDDTLTISIADAEDPFAATIELKSKDDELFLEMSNDEFSGTLIFTADGTTKNAKEISFAEGSDITSEDELLGTWNLTGVRMMGASMYGDASDLSVLAGSEDASITFEAGGTCTMFGGEATWTVGADGAAIESLGISMPVKSIGDDIMLDVSELMSAMGSEYGEMVYVFSK